jgi:hypothetical protein
MKWLSLDTTPPSYRSACKQYLIVHEVAGFGIWPLRLYHRGVRIREWAGERGEEALSEAMSAAERHANPIPECDLPRCEVVR